MNRTIGYTLIFLAFAMLWMPLVLARPHLDEINTPARHTELCVYKGKLAAVFAYFKLVDHKAESDIEVRWHGDETPFERQVVSEVRALVWGAYDKVKTFPEVGELVYQACMKGSDA